MAKIIAKKSDICYNIDAMEMKIDRKAAVKKLKFLVLSPKDGVESFRSLLEKKFRSDFIPNGVECVERQIGDIQCDVLSPEIFASNRIMIYIHGGSFVGGSRESWRTFCAVIANASSSRLIIPEFRLPPSHSFPSSIEDIESVFKEIIQDKSYSEIIIGADGSGASIAMAFMFRLEESERSLVSKILLFSPWLDLTGEGLSGKKPFDGVLGREDLRHAADLYTYSSNLVSPQVSPLRASVKDFAFFPEVYIQCGEKEFILSQAEKFHSLLLKVGVKSFLDVVPEMMFMFQMADEFLLESHTAIERAGKYISQRLRLSESEEKERKRLMRENNIAQDLGDKE